MLYHTQLETAASFFLGYSMQKNHNDPLKLFADITMEVSSNSVDLSENGHGLRKMACLVLALALA